MKKWNIKSYAKINLCLRVLGKFKNNYHKIEIIISPINFYDEIIIKQIKKKNHEVFFYGRFSRGIPKINTVTKILKIMFDTKAMPVTETVIQITLKKTKQQMDFEHFFLSLPISFPGTTGIKEAQSGGTIVKVK